MEVYLILYLCIIWSRITAIFTSNGGSEYDGDSFSCAGKVIGGYYADVANNCQTFQVCTLGENNALQNIVIKCVEGTVFNQQTRVCERTEEVDCSISKDYYYLNNELYGPGIIPDSALSQNLYSTDARRMTLKQETEKISPLTMRENYENTGFNKGIGETLTDTNTMIKMTDNDKYEALSLKKFSCDNKQVGSVHADQEAGCIMFHLCYRNSKNMILPATFMCDKGYLFDQISGKCKPADQVKCRPAHYSNKDYEDICSDEKTGYGKADPKTHCKFFIRTITDEEGNRKRKIPCLCPDLYAFSEKTQKCEHASEVKCQGNKFARFKRKAGPQMNNELMLNDYPDNARAQRALDNLADLNRWAQQNSEHSLFVDMYELHDGKIKEQYPKKVNNNQDKLHKYFIAGRLSRKKRSSNASTSSSNVTNADDVNSLINTTSLEKHNKTIDDKETENSSPVSLPSEDQNENSESTSVASLVESISEPSTNTKKKEAMVLSKNSFQSINKNSNKKVINEDAEEIFTEPLGTDSPAQNKQDIKDPDMIEFIEPELSQSSSSKTHEPILSSTTTTTTKSTTPTTTPTTSSTQKPSVASTTEKVLTATPSTSSLHTTASTTEVTKPSTSTSKPSTASTAPTHTTENTSASTPIVQTTSATTNASTASTSTQTTSSKATTASITLPSTTTSPSNVSTASTVSKQTSPQPTTTTTTSTINELSTTTSNKTLNQDSSSTSTIPPSTTPIITTPKAVNDSLPTEIVPETNFTCKGKKLEQFYPDPEANCQAFHYCSPGFVDNQVLDLKFLCKGETKFDLESQKCVDRNKVTCDVPVTTTTTSTTTTTITSTTPTTTTPTTTTTSTTMTSVPTSTTTVKTPVSENVTLTTPPNLNTTKEINQTTASNVSVSDEMTSTKPTTTLEVTPENSTVNHVATDVTTPVQNTTTTEKQPPQEKPIEDTLKDTETTMFSLTNIRETSEPEIVTNPAITEEPPTDEVLPTEYVTTDIIIEESVDSTTQSMEAITEMVTESPMELKSNSNPPLESTSEKSSLVTSKSKTEQSHSVSTDDNTQSPSIEITFSTNSQSS